MSDVAAKIREVLDGGRNTEALDLARQGAPGDPRNAEIRYLGALASARMGATGEAELWLAQIDREALGATPLTAEVWSLAGRIAKDRFATQRDRMPELARGFARTAIDSYRRAFDLSGSAYPAVNAATMARLAGDDVLARTLAGAALSAMGPTGDHWHHASAGEARLLLGDIGAARAHYAEAHRLAGNRYGDIAAMRRQLLLIGSSAARDLMAAVPAPVVVAFSGHMIDHRDRPSPRFPASLEPAVARALRERLATFGPAIGFSQAACGADILFLEALQEAGLQTNVVLPFAPADYLETSVRFAGAAWVARFERVVDRASQVVLATEEAFLGDDILYEHAGNLIQGMAFLRAKELSTQPLLLTVHDSTSSGGAGGTAATLRAWSPTHRRVETIDLAALRDANVAAIPVGRGDIGAWEGTADAGGVARSDVARAPTSARRSARCLQSLLFADISGFSRLPEKYTPHFVEVFLGTCKEILDGLRHRPVDVNTLGDGLYLVFDRPSHAAEFATRLQRALGKVDWQSIGMAHETAARIGLHTGPVLRTFDPVMGKTAFYGTHVNRTARLEPVVRPGHIFVTEAFAASLAAEQDERYTCNYIGALPLAKQFGEARLYRLQAMDDA